VVHELARQFEILLVLHLSSGFQKDMRSRN
jgi:hypothetical protein